MSYDNDDATPAPSGLVSEFRFADAWWRHSQETCEGHVRIWTTGVGGARVSVRQDVGTDVFHAWAAQSSVALDVFERDLATALRAGVELGRRVASLAVLEQFVDGPDMRDELARMFWRYESDLRRNGGSSEEFRFRRKLKHAATSLHRIGGHPR